MNTSIRWLSLTACLLLALAGGGCKKKQVPQAEPVDTAVSNLQTRVSPAPLVVTQQVAVASARASAHASANATINLGASGTTNVRNATEVVSVVSEAPSSSDTSASIPASSAVAASASAVSSPAAIPADVGFAAGQGKHYESQLPSKVRVEGTSTIHAWTVEGQIIVGYLDVDPAFAISSLQPGKIKAQATVRIPVRTLKSGNKMMDDIMYRQMKMTQHRDITYRLAEWTLKETPSSSGPAQGEATGFLIVSGVTNAITMPVTLESAASDKLLIKGSANLKMTDFDIAPPELTLGVTPIKTGNEVKVSFEWLLAPKT